MVRETSRLHNALSRAFQPAQKKLVQDMSEEALNRIVVAADYDAGYFNEDVSEPEEPQA
jgi:hypothetical protein